MIKYLRWFFSCKHPAFWLRNQEIRVEKYDRDFNDVVMSFHCDKCNEDGEVRYATLRGGVDGFMERMRESEGAS